jgi:hypothetical protein
MALSGLKIVQRATYLRSTARGEIFAISQAIAKTGLNGGAAWSSRLAFELSLRQPHLQAKLRAGSTIKFRNISVADSVSSRTPRFYAQASFELPSGSFKPMVEAHSRSCT